MLKDDIKARTLAAMKSGDTVARDVLRLALGEIQMGEVRADENKTTYTEEAAQAAVRKLMKSNEETRSQLPEGDERIAAIVHENEVLAGLLPKRLGADEIAKVLEPVAETIRAAKTDGQATGVAMKHLKSTGADADGTTVAAAVKILRS